ncbi:MAG: histidinol-phosphatase HisJ family protein [Clostridia bacterium]|nr:histidinol-phosphatase HisJ family protein [Clostridia bacterium]
MYDFHLHTTVSFDGISDAAAMAEVASCRGLREICFTDHADFLYEKGETQLYDLREYAHAYDHLEIPGLVIRRGTELGLTVWSVEESKKFLAMRPYDFVIGSVHYTEFGDPYYPAFWDGRSGKEAFLCYLTKVLNCVRIHDDFDVLGHLTYVCKSVHNPTHEPVKYEDFREITDEILRILVAKGKGMEINTSGVDKAGAMLPSAEFLRRFRELGGEIVTVGSDAHDVSRVGQYVDDAIELLRDIFGYVCTFEGRKPIFHKL